jgi:hypothetical protein
MERGPEGREGPAGREGVAGREGQPGVEGDLGATGATGATGPKGATGEALPRRVRLSFVGLTAVFTVVVAVLGFFANENRQRAVEGRIAHNVLCVERANQLERLKRADELLKQQGDVIIYLGLRFPRDEVVRSRFEAAASLRASEPLECDPSPTPTITTDRLP